MWPEELGSAETACPRNVFLRNPHAREEFRRCGSVLVEIRRTGIRGELLRNDFVDFSVEIGVVVAGFVVVFGGFPIVLFGFCLLKLGRP